jgi:methionyl-tRNA formyltransferase
MESFHVSSDLSSIRMKIAYCGYDFFHGNLRALLEDGHDIGQVFTVDTDNQWNFNQYIYDICRQYDLPVTDQPVSNDDIGRLEADGFDVIVTSAYYYRIPDLADSRLKGINVHPTLLPVGRGVWPLPWTILTEQRQSGVTIHKLAPQLDAGDILLQDAFELTPHENLESLSARVQLLARRMIVEVFADFESRWSAAQPQPENATTWPRPSLEQQSLDWNTSVAEIDRISRAFGKYGCFADFDNCRWRVTLLNAWPESHDYQPGAVVHKTNMEMIVAAADGLVSLQYFRRLKAVE